MPCPHSCLCFSDQTPPPPHRASFYFSQNQKKHTLYNLNAYSYEFNIICKLIHTMFWISKQPVVEKFKSSNTLNTINIFQGLSFYDPKLTLSEQMIIKIHQPFYSGQNMGGMLQRRDTCKGTLETVISLSRAKRYAQKCFRG